VKTVFVVGAGPAGMFAAQKIAQGGHEVIILNRDIKPGGLAEYGIYPTKDKMKIGLRKQFAKVLSLPNVHYFHRLRHWRAGDQEARASRRRGQGRVCGQGFCLQLQPPAAVYFA
jgi:ferredoxin--NADP+ reductase